MQRRNDIAAPYLKYQREIVPWTWASEASFE
jgi:hypothetical protein